ncbi:hypothetical protein [Nostoc sp.]|uniref:hypothetical protein n=1 Tax=Nostoc sp. TaxID=1180 RepID=UPI002FF80E25
MAYFRTSGFQPGTDTIPYLGHKPLLKFGVVFSLTFYSITLEPTELHPIKDGYQGSRGASRMGGFSDLYNWRSRVQDRTLDS